MKRIALLFTLAIGIGSLTAQINPTYHWMINEAEGPNDQYITTFDDDSLGNLYCGGMIRNLGAGSYTHFNNGDSILFPGTTNGFRGFLAKIDSNGIAQWTKDFTQGSQKGVRKVTVSPDNELYVSSYTEGPVILDGVSISGRSIYLFKYDLNGTLLTNHVFAVTGTSYGLDDLVVDKAGNAYLAGYFNNSITFGSTTVSASNGSTFHVKIDKNGNVKWIKQFTGRTWAIELANDGDLLIAGRCSSSAQFGTFTANSTNFKLPFLVKLDSADGTPIFLNTPTSVNGGEGISIVQDESDNIYLGGFFGRTFGPVTNSDMDFGNFVLKTIGANKTSGFIAKYSASGNPIWAKAMGGQGYGHVHNLVYRKGEITVNGELKQDGLFPNGNDSLLIHTFDIAPYFATIDTAGTWLGARATSFYQYDLFDFIQTKTGSLYFTGQFGNTFEYNDGQDSIVSAGNLDGVIAKLNDISTISLVAPSNLQVNAYGSLGWNATTQLTWTDNSTNEYGFYFYGIYQEDRKGPARAPANTTIGITGGLWEGLVYDYYVHSHKYDMLSAPSNGVMDTAKRVVGLGTIEHSINQIKLEVYPNPSSGIINLEASKDIREVQIFDLTGKRLFVSPLNSNQNQLDLRNLPKGVYLIQLNFDEGNLKRKIILR